MRAGGWLVLGLLGSCGYRSVPTPVRPLEEPRLQPARIEALADRLLQGEPRVVLIGESHYEAAQTRFATDLILELAERGWVDVVVLEAPWSESLVHAGVAEGEARPVRLTIDDNTALDRLHGHNQAHPDTSFRILSNDLEMGTAAQRRVLLMLERRGLEVSDASLRTVAREGGPDGHLAANALATHEAFAVADADFQRVRQERVIATLTDPERNGGWLEEGEHVVFWLGSKHTRLGTPCDGVRFEGCVIEDELGLVARSVQMRSASFTAGWMAAGGLEACEGTEITEWMSWEVLTRIDVGFARRGYGNDLMNPDVSRHDLRRSWAFGGEGPVLWLDPERASGHDAVVVFPSTELHQPLCTTRR